MEKREETKEDEERWWGMGGGGGGGEEDDEEKTALGQYWSVIPSALLYKKICIQYSKKYC